MKDNEKKQPLAADELDDVSGGSAQGVGKPKCAKCGVMPVGTEGSLCIRCMSVGPAANTGNSAGD